eukprot:1144977-Pelagomonas_calceolata.AAC.7
MPFCSKENEDEQAVFAGWTIVSYHRPQTLQATAPVLLALALADGWGPAAQQQQQQQQHPPQIASSF